MNQTKKLVYTALFTALCCVGTMVIQIPTPATHGYIHLGDAFSTLLDMRTSGSRSSIPFLVQ